MGRKPKQTFRMFQQTYEKMFNTVTIGEMQIKSAISPHTSQNGYHKKKSTNAGEGVERRGPSYTVDGNVNWCSLYGEQQGGSFKKLKIELPQTLQSHSWAYTWSRKDTCTPMFIEGPFTIAKTWTQPKCPCTEEYIKRWYIYTMEYLQE